MERPDLTPSWFPAGGETAASERVSQFLRGVYTWMCAGLAITGLVAYAILGSPALLGALIGNRALVLGLFLAQLAMVFVLVARVERLAPRVAAGLFIAYSALMGVTMSLVFLIYTGESVASTFAVTACMFGALALYGSLTSRNLAGLGQFAFMGLIGVIIASVVGFFWQNDALQFLISVAGVIVFTALTAYDAQRLRRMALALPGGQTTSYAVVGALALYLNFINLFLFLLRFMGTRRQ